MIETLIKKLKFQKKTQIERKAKSNFYGIQTRDISV